MVPPAATAPGDGTTGTTGTDPARLLARYGAARIAMGVALTVAPTLAGTPWLGGAARDPVVRATLRLVGVRDVLLGAGAVASMPGGTAGWALAGAAADAADLVVTLATRSRLPRSARGVAALAAAGTLTGLHIARRAAGTR